MVYFKFYLNISNIFNSKDLMAMELNALEVFRVKIILLYAIQMLNVYYQVDVNANLVILVMDNSV